MSTEFQRRKIAGVFNAMDANSDGLLEQADFEALTERWLAVRDREPERDARLKAIMMGWWDTLLHTSDVNRDHKVTLDEVLLVVDRLHAMADVIAGTARAMFEAIDENGDGEISGDEYRRLIEAWSGKRVNTDEVFPLLDSDGDGRLSKAEFAELWTEFWAGDDPEARGTWVFGRFELPVG
ncbi:EF-hand domain-containing protein [Amycolatopsis magusensis]|uniref:Ca2+-binding EF-hand superfamily protein n=1 Tax=Amycolatopsis magusensis TaxID=882444 RepID=A0ABS4Q6L9_9PSEU|nr:EF-hand domain-containing protein [Amycolatopsis magusensis]MBP2186401.1 Ca2+-binding EF-hand superfamily protein [Amycolatopsis magusensis]MDI5975984.1 EF-hand domain-containing protein [Amycolatopsis magusensis]